MPRTSATLAAIILALGLLAAAVPVDAGSASDPEVPDDPNDVAGQLNTGNQSGNQALQGPAEQWADLTAVWYDGETQGAVTVNVQVVMLPPVQDQQLPGQPAVTYTVNFQTHSVSAQNVPGFEDNLFIGHEVTITPAVNGPADADACALDGQAANVSRVDDTTISCTIPKSAVAPDQRNNSLYPGDMLMNHSAESEVNLGSPPLVDFAENLEPEGFFFFQQTSNRPPAEDDGGNGGGGGGGGNGNAPPPEPESTPGFEVAALLAAAGAAAWAVKRRR